MSYGQFYCQACGKMYQQCECEVYMSASAPQNALQTSQKRSQRVLIQFPTPDKPDAGNP